MFILHICYFRCLYIIFFKPITFFILELSSPPTKRKNLSAILNHKEVKRIIMHNYKDLEGDKYVFFFFNFTYFIREDKNNK